MWDHILHEPLRIVADVVVLATAIVPNPANADLARIYKLSTDADGFLHGGPCEAPAGGFRRGRPLHGGAGPLPQVRRRGRRAGQGCGRAGPSPSCRATALASNPSRRRPYLPTVTAAPFAWTSALTTPSAWWRKPRPRASGPPTSRSMWPSARDAACARRPVPRTASTWRGFPWSRSRRR